MRFFQDASRCSPEASWARTKVLTEAWRPASGKLLDNGKTAEATFADTLAELEAKVGQLGEDLAAQDAHAFLVHSRFLSQKFGPQGLDSPALNTFAAEERKP